MMNIYEPVQGNSVNADALEHMQSTIEGVSVLIDSLTFTINSIGVPENMDSVRALITEQLDSVAGDLQTIRNAASGKQITITDRAA